MNQIEITDSYNALSTHPEISSIIKTAINTVYADNPLSLNTRVGMHIAAHISLKKQHADLVETPLDPVLSKECIKALLKLSNILIENINIFAEPYSLATNLVYGLSSFSEEGRDYPEFQSTYNSILEIERLRPEN